MSELYVVKEGGLYVLRQVRYKEKLEAGKEHPHDICAYARSIEEIHQMLGHVWPDIDYSAVYEGDS